MGQGEGGGTWSSCGCCRQWGAWPVRVQGCSVTMAGEWLSGVAGLREWEGGVLAERSGLEGSGDPRQPRRSNSCEGARS